MKTADFLRELEAAIDAEPGSLTPAVVLADVPRWDSLAVIMFLALADEQLGQPVEGDALIAAKTVGALLALVHNGLEDYEAAA